LFFFSLFLFAQCSGGDEDEGTGGALKFQAPKDPSRQKAQPVRLPFLLSLSLFFHYLSLSRQLGKHGINGIWRALFIYSAKNDPSRNTTFFFSRHGDMMMMFNLVLRLLYCDFLF
jgi:hypothetical protein